MEDLGIAAVQTYKSVHEMHRRSDVQEYRRVVPRWLARFIDRTIDKTLLDGGIFFGCTPMLDATVPLLDV